jgi:hypothetical protein
MLKKLDGLASLGTKFLEDRRFRAHPFSGEHAGWESFSSRLAKLIPPN